MIYDDFPILNNSDYELMNSHYKPSKGFDRKTLTFNIYGKLYECKQTCSNLKHIYNQKINSTLTVCSQTFDKLCNNFKSLFNISILPNNTYCSSSIFSLLKKINNLVLQISNWNKLETKEYYKTIVHKTNLDLINISTDILSNLEISNILFFKHM